MDVATSGPEPPPRPPRQLSVRWWAVLVAVAVAVPVAPFAFDRDHNNHTLLTATPTPTPTPSTRSRVGAAPCEPVASVGGLVVDPDRLGLAGMLERLDENAAKGPWTVVVRRPEGWLGKNGVVVTFPAEPPMAGRPIDVNGVAGSAAGNMVVWPIGGAYARVRGDLGEPELLRVASATAVVDGKPVVRPIDGLTVVSSGPYRPPSIHEVRYGSSSVGEEETLGSGLAYTGVVAGGGFEDQLYARENSPGGTVHCRTATVSTVLGGNATLAWEPLPGTVAYVGYSGAAMAARTLDALQRFADRCRVLSASEWRAALPRVQYQNNDVS